MLAHDQLNLAKPGAQAKEVEEMAHPLIFGLSLSFLQ